MAGHRRSKNGVASLAYVPAMNRNEAEQHEITSTVASGSAMPSPAFDDS
jgi:hypothetical protein